jgi:hypothetical protein
MDQKKEYVTSKMDVLEYMVQTSLLQGSPDAPELTNGEFD